MLSTKMYFFIAILILITLLAYAGIAGFFAENIFLNFIHITKTRLENFSDQRAVSYLPVLVYRLFKAALFFAVFLSFRILMQKMRQTKHSVQDNFFLRDE